VSQPTQLISMESLVLIFLFSLVVNGKCNALVLFNGGNVFSNPLCVFFLSYFTLFLGFFLYNYLLLTEAVFICTKIQQNSHFAKKKNFI